MSSSFRTVVVASAAAGALFLTLSSRTTSNEPEAAVATKPSGPLALGINLAELTWYSTEQPFVDVFKMSSPFLHQSEGTWQHDDPLVLRADGYPARLEPRRFAGALMFREIGGRYPPGDYTCSYDGDGDLHFGFDAALLRGEPGKLTVRVKPSEAGIWLKIVRTNPDDPVRNIRMLAPGFDPATAPTFHPDFLARWRGIRVLRFMDWMRTNGAKVTKWLDRTTPSSQTQAGEHGVAIEHIAELANELDADPWVCIPHRADDEYVVAMAQLLADRLDPDRRVWVEYSNEAWNGAFEQARWCQEQGLQAKLSADAFSAQLRFYSQRAIATVNAFAQAFRASDRVTRVVAAQHANPWTSQEILQWQDAWQRADVLAIAPYFGNGFGDPLRRFEVASWSVDQLLDRCQTEANAAIKAVQVHLRAAQTRDLQLAAYEAGQHLVGYQGAENDETLTKLFAAANRDPAMGRIYADYIRSWHEAGGGLLCLFHSTGAYTKWGCWGLAEHYGEGSAAAPKLQAVRAALGAHPGSAPR